MTAGHRTVMNHMTAAQTAQQSNRDNGGRYATKQLDESGLTDLSDDMFTDEFAFEMNRMAIENAISAKDEYDLAMASTALLSTMPDGADGVDALRRALDHGSHDELREEAQRAVNAGSVHFEREAGLVHEGRTPTQWREQAAQHRRSAADSFARSDTDGFRSQAASEAMARLCDARSDLAENSGMAEFPALLDTDGNLVPAQMVSTTYGQAWALIDSDNQFTGKFVNASQASTASKRNAAMAKKGYQVGTVKVPAKLVLSDGLQPYPVLVRTDNGFDPNAEVTATSDSDD